MVNKMNSLYDKNTIYEVCVNKMFSKHVKSF